MTPFQMAWDLLKTEINPKPHPSDYPALRYMNQPSPDNFNPITAIEGVRNEDDLIERSIDSGWNEAQDAMAWEAFTNRDDTNVSEGQELMNRLMSGSTLSTDELTRLMEWDGHMGPTDWGISPPTPREEEINKVRDFVNNQPQKPNYGIPMQTEQTRLPTLPSSIMFNPVIGNAKLKEMNRRIAENKNKPYRLGSNSHQVDQEVNRNNNIRRFKDQQAAAKLHLRDNPPRLERGGYDESGGNLYNIMSGYEEIGHVGIDEMDGGIGYGEVKPAYQRQGLYGKTLQAIINERNILHSSNRNHNSQPFHEQFNPPNTGKHVINRNTGERIDNAYESSNFSNGMDRYTYRAFPPQETPENWGALEYDTGALPIYQEKPAEERNAISPRSGSRQINLEDYWGLEQRFNPQFPFDRQPGQYYPNRED